MYSKIKENFQIKKRIPEGGISDQLGNMIIIKKQGILKRWTEYVEN